MRILFAPAARLLSDTEANGESLIAVAFLRALTQRGHTAVAYVEHDRLSQPIEGVEVREISAEGPSAGAGRLGFARRIAVDAAKESFDIVHLLFPFNTQDGYTLVRGAPLVAGPINLPWPSTVATTPRMVARVGNAYTDRLERRLHMRTLRRAAALLMTGPSSLAALPAAVHDRAVELPFGVDVATFPSMPVLDDPAILFLSVLQPRKGIEVLLRAMPTVRERVPRAHLLVAGSDPTEITPRLAALADQLGITDAVRFLGPVGHDEVAKTYARAGVFCQPSFGEPFGMTVLEAMACGRPVVATAAGGIPDAVVDGSGGMLAPPGDPRLLADALIQVLEKPGVAARMGAYNRARIEERYDIVKIVDRLEQIYDRVRAGKRPE